MKLFRLNEKNVEKLLDMLNIDNFYGEEDQILYNLDGEILFRIKGSKIIADFNKVLIGRLGLKDLSRREVKLLKSIIVSHIMMKIEKKEEEIKQMLLKKIGIDEEQFLFLLKKIIQ